MLSADEANRRYFRRAYETAQHGWATHEPSAYVAAFLERLRTVIPGGTLLDIGCGEARHAIAAARLGFEVTAIDYEPAALKRARRFAREEGVAGITFRKADVFRMPFPGASFDVVLDFGCLHHQRKSDWPAYKAGILRVLKPEGFYLLAVFSPKFPMFRGSRRRWHVAQGAYRRCFTAGDIQALFRRDFDILELREEGRPGLWHSLMRRRS